MYVIRLTYITSIINNILRGLSLMQSIRGMYDILPEDIKYWQHIYHTALQVLGRASYHEIRTPIIEETSLFLRSIGEDTDIVNKEMYNFIDKSNRKLTLRPEGTASVARAIVQHGLCSEQHLQKLWYLGPMFRYERPQHGRQRQFHQLGLECYGSDSPILDAEIIYLANNLLETLGCNNYRIEINSIGSSENREKYQIALKNYLKKYEKDLDKRSKIQIITNPIKLLDSKNMDILQILEEAPNIQDFLDRRGIEHFEKVQASLESLDINFTINNKLVRGLDYYNNTVFEIKTNLLGTQDTICGGGRYDELTQQLGANKIHAIGWGIGVERLLLLIKDKIVIENQRLSIYLAMQGDNAIQYGLTLIPFFHSYNLTYEMDISDIGFQKQIKKANQKGALICVIIGENERKNQQITVKWLQEYKQAVYSRQDFLDTIKNIERNSFTSEIIQNN